SLSGQIPSPGPSFATTSAKSPSSVRAQQSAFTSPEKRVVTSSSKLWTTRTRGCTEGRIAMDMKWKCVELAQASASGNTPENAGVSVRGHSGRHKPEKPRILACGCLAPEETTQAEMEVGARPDGGCGRGNRSYLCHDAHARNQLPRSPS